MTPVSRAHAAPQPASLVTLDLAPAVLFVALKATTKRVTLLHPCGATIAVPAWRVRLMAG